jgi:hypothetical protein
MKVDHRVWMKMSERIETVFPPFLKPLKNHRNYIMVFLYKRRIHWFAEM